MDSENQKSSAMGLCGGKSPLRDTAAGCKRATLRERVENQMNHAQQEASRANRLGELAYLLDKNPEVARILDLIEEVRG